MLRINFCAFVLAILFIFFSTVNAQLTIPSDKEQLLKGETAGANSVAENNGFISPQKILDLKDQLGLTRDQLKKINEMMTNQPVSVTVKGQEIIETEEELNRLFEAGNINEKTLRLRLERIGKLRADLRFLHLQVYLKVRQILSVNQLNRLKEILESEVK